MNCQGCEAQIQAYLDGELNENDKQVVEEHLSNCRECSALFQELKNVNRLINKAFEKRPTPTTIVSKVLVGITEVSERAQKEEEKDAAGRLVGQTIGGYKLLQKIGTGGMGSVYKAVQLSMNRIVAFKVLSTKLSKDSNFVARFMREARSAGTLNHPNIVRVYDIGTDKGIYFISMEYVEGETLFGILSSENRLEPVHALKITLQVAHALKHAQKHNIVHRDIKPENIMIDKDGHVKLADMGLAKQLGNQDASITVHGEAIGSPHYMSPEQIDDTASVDQRADIYSLGATLYHILTGAPPFDDKTGMDALASVVHEELVFTPEHDTFIPVQISQLVKKMTAKDPCSRHQTATLLVTDIEKILQGPFTFASVTPRTPVVPKPRPIRAAAIRRETRTRLRKKKTPIAPILIAAALLVAAIIILPSLIKSRNSSPVEEYSTASNNETEPDNNTRRVKPQPPIKNNPQKNPEADKEFKEASKLLAKLPLNYAELIRRFKEIETKYPDTEAAKKATDVYEQLNKELLSAYQEMSKLANSAISRSDFATATTRCIEFIERYPQTKYADDTKKLLSYIDESRRSKFDNDLREAKVYIDDGKFNEALPCIERIKQYGTEEMIKKAEQLITQVNELITKAEEIELQKQRRGKMQALYEIISESLVEHKYTEALEKLKICADNPNFSDISKLIELEQYDISLLVKHEEYFFTAISKLASEGGAWSLLRRGEDRPVRGVISELQGQGIFTMKVENERNATFINLNTIAPEEVVRLTQIIAPKDDIWSSVRCGLFYLFEGEFKKAQEEFEKAKQQKELSEKLTALWYPEKTDIVHEAIIIIVLEKEV
ncbi:MAG: protein kinase, partial [Planctomycetota bacterium]